MPSEADHVHGYGCRTPLSSLLVDLTLTIIREGDQVGGDACKSAQRYCAVVQDCS